MYESETTSLTKKPPRTQLPIGLMKTMGVNKYQKCEQIDSKCERKVICDWNKQKFGEEK